MRRRRRQERGRGLRRRREGGGEWEGGESCRCACRLLAWIRVKRGENSRESRKLFVGLVPMDKRPTVKERLEIVTINVLAHCKSRFGRISENLRGISNWHGSTKAWILRSSAADAYFLNYLDEAFSLFTTYNKHLKNMPFKLVVALRPRCARRKGRGGKKGKRKRRVER
jgi:hypothetical protein